MRDTAHLSDDLLEQAKQIAHLRLDSDSYYADKLGKTPKNILTYEDRFQEELRAVCSQLTVQICLELPLWQPTTMLEARRVGNAGGGHSAYMPKDENLRRPHLIVDPKSLDGITYWLVIPSDGDYWLKGWISGWVAKTYPLKDWIRPDSGMRSVAHWIPGAAMNPTYERE